MSGTPHCAHLTSRKLEQVLSFFPPCLFVDEVAVDTSVFANMDPDDLEDVAEDVGAHAADLFAGETFSDEDFS